MGLLMSILALDKLGMLVSILDFGIYEHFHWENIQFDMSCMTESDFGNSDSVDMLCRIFLRLLCLTF
jgi:hypothetical protein